MKNWLNLSDISFIQSAQQGNPYGVIPPLLCRLRYDYTPTGATVIEPVTPPAPTGSTLRVGTGQTYPNLASALDEASNGDLILLNDETHTVSTASARSDQGHVVPSTNQIFIYNDGVALSSYLPGVVKVKLSSISFWQEVTVRGVNIATDTITYSGADIGGAGGGHTKITFSSIPNTIYWTIWQSATSFKIASSYNNAASGLAVDLNAGFSSLVMNNIIRTVPSLPSPLIANTDYWTSAASDGFRLATSSANARTGVYIDLSDSGTGIFSIVVQGLVVNKSVTIQGSSRSGTIITDSYSFVDDGGQQTAYKGFFNINSSNVVIKDCTIKNIKGNSNWQFNSFQVFGASSFSYLPITSGTTTTMTVSGTPWVTSQWVGAKVEFTSGPNAGLSRIISSNNSNTITFSSLPSVVSSSHSYSIVPMNIYFENVTLKSARYGALSLYSDNWQVNNCSISYIGANTSPVIHRWLTTVPRSNGQGLFTNNTYDSGQGTAYYGPSAISAFTSSTLTVAGAPWITNQWVGYTVEIVSGTGAGQLRTVTSNTSSTLTTSSVFTASLSSQFKIRSTGETVVFNVGGSEFDNTYSANQKLGGYLRIGNTTSSNSNPVKRLFDCGSFIPGDDPLTLCIDNNSTKSNGSSGETDAFAIWMQGAAYPALAQCNQINIENNTLSNSHGKGAMALKGNGYTGRVTSTTSTTITDSSMNWSVNQLAGKLLMADNGSGNMVSVTIVSNTSTTYTVSTGGFIPSVGTSYAIEGAMPLGTTTLYASGNSLTSTSLASGWASGLTGSSDPSVLAQLSYETAGWLNPGQAISVPSGLRGLSTVDGVALQSSYRVLVVDSSNAVNSGVYVASSGSWSRSSDLTVGADAAGKRVAVSHGTLYANTNWLCTSSSPAVVGTAPLTFVAT